MRSNFLTIVNEIKIYGSHICILKQKNMSNIIQMLQRIAPLSEEDCKRFMEITTISKLNKGDYWIESEKMTTKVSFLEEGYLRKFYVKDGNEITDFFYFKNDFCADLPSIFGRSLPHASIVAMEETTLTEFSYNDFNELCKTALALEHLNRVIAQFTFLRFHNRTVSFIFKTPKERYEELLINEPKVLQNVAQDHIASYIGISTEYLVSLRAGN